MRYFSFRSSWHIVLWLGGLLLTACTLHEEAIEPALPTQAIDDQSTVRYYRDGVPVLAHVYSNIGTFFFIFIPGYSGPPVGADYHPESKVMYLQAIDSQNKESTGTISHQIALALKPFRGVGTYTPSTGLSEIRYEEYEFTGEQWEPRRSYTSTPSPGQQLIVTRWDSVQQRLEGTFELEVTESSGPPVRLSDGRFFLKVK